MMTRPRSIHPLGVNSRCAVSSSGNVTNTCSFYYLSFPGWHRLPNYVSIHHHAMCSSTIMAPECITPLPILFLSMALYQSTEIIPIVCL